MKKKLALLLLVLTLFANFSTAGVIVITPNSKTSTSAPTSGVVTTSSVTTSSATTTDSTSWIGRLMSMFSLWL